MKKQKIALNKLVLNKERIADLNQVQQDNVVGGGTLYNTCICQTLACPSIAIACMITRVGPGCVIGPVSFAGGCPPQSLACNPQSLACTTDTINPSGGSIVQH